MVEFLISWLTAYSSISEASTIRASDKLLTKNRSPHPPLLKIVRIGSSVILESLWTMINGMNFKMMTVLMMELMGMTWSGMGYRTP